MLSDEELAAIEGRALVASPAPWTVATWEGRPASIGWQQGGLRTAVCIRPKYRDDWLESDADFIAHARQDIPALLEEVRRLRSQIELIHKYSYTNPK